jgi:sugar phosphate isomerase/epimerase
VTITVRTWPVPARPLTAGGGQRVDLQTARRCLAVWGIFETYAKLDVDGAELAFLPEWDASQPPVTPTSADWRVTPKISHLRLVDLCASHGIRVPVVHINRDVGTRLSSESRDSILSGQKVLNEDLAAASVLESEIGVLHLWDTYAESLNIDKLFARVYEVSRDHRIRLAIENIPISDPNLTTSEVWTRLSEIMPSDYGFTLDLSWSSLYGDFAELLTHMSRILHVHVQGAVSSTADGRRTLVPRVGKLDILDSLGELCSAGYDRTITLELHRPTGLHDFETALDLIASRI